MNNITGAGILIINSDNDIILFKQNDGKYADLGGRKETYETLKECAIREANEETYFSYNFTENMISEKLSFVINNRYKCYLYIDKNNTITKQKYIQNLNVPNKFSNTETFGIKFFSLKKIIYNSIKNKKYYKNYSFRSRLMAIIQHLLSCLV